MNVMEQLISACVDARALYEADPNARTRKNLEMLMTALALVTWCRMETLDTDTDLSEIAVVLPKRRQKGNLAPAKASA